MQTPPRPDDAVARTEDSDPASHPPLGPQEPGSEGDLPQASAALQLSCAHNEVRACTYYLPEHNGVRQCVVGYQVCSDNEWSPCLEGVAVDGGPSTEPGGSF
jgi:hypothetical protein